MEKFKIRNLIIITFLFIICKYEYLLCKYIDVKEQLKYFSEYIYYEKYLKNKYDAEIFIFKDTSKERIDIEKRAKNIFENLKSSYKNIIVIYLNTISKSGKILISEELSNKIKNENLLILQTEIIDKLIGKWYVSEFNFYIKIIATLFYFLEKENITGKEKERIAKFAIFLDDKLFQISLKKPLNDIIKLFYFEPISFIIYFPFITYFILVRIIGFKLGKTGFYLMNMLWVIFIIFLIILIANRIKIIFPEYVNLFMMFCGFNIPVFIYLFFIYKDEIERCIYNYFNKITGGFNENIFQKD